MTALNISPESLQPITAFQEAVNAPQATSTKSLVIGETLNALVISNPYDQKVRLQIKNLTIVADSQLPLQTGRNLTVCVDQLHPTVVLRIINTAEAESQRTNEFLKLYRSNPCAFRDLLVYATDLFRGENVDPFFNCLGEKNVQAISNLLDQIVISKSNINNPLCLKNCITALGLTFERNLMKGLSDPGSLTAEKNNPTLKEILLKLSSELLDVESTRDFTTKELPNKIESFSKFVDQALQFIESLQIANVLAQEQDNLFAFQIPFQCSDGIKMQDIFIETEDDRSRQNSSKPYRIVMFLDMDALGELAVEASLKEKSLRCTIRCQNKDTLNFIENFLHELQKKLSDVGYADSHVQCILDRDLPSWKQDFLLDHSLYSQSTVNICV